MSSRDDIPALLSELVTTLQEIESEVEPTTENGLPRPPTPAELVRFTSDVAIPAGILILKTNIEALKLLRRTLRMAEGRPATEGSNAGEVRERATRLSRATLDKLDSALADLQDAMAGQPTDDEARELLREARELRAELDDRLADEGSNGATADTDDVDVDIDAEIRSLKAEVDDLDDDGDNSGNEDGADNSPS